MNNDQPQPSDEHYPSPNIDTGVTVGSLIGQRALTSLPRPR